MDFAGLPLDTKKGIYFPIDSAEVAKSTGFKALKHSGIALENEKSAS
jgi:hypothetical protein